MRFRSLFRIVGTIDCLIASFSKSSTILNQPDLLGIESKHSALRLSDLSEKLWGEDENGQQATENLLDIIARTKLVRDGEKYTDGKPSFL